MPKRSQIAAAVAAPSTYFLQVSLSVFQTGGSVLDFIRPIMPFLSGILGFFGNLLTPLGEFFGTLLEGPLTALSQAIPARSVTGYALYFVVFAGIFMLALFLNVIWRPLGYATEDSRAKRDAKGAKEAERETAKEEAKARRKASKKKPDEGAPDDKPEEGPPAEPTGGKADGTDEPRVVPSPPPAAEGKEKETEKEKGEEKAEDKVGKGDAAEGDATAGTGSAEEE